MLTKEDLIIKKIDKIDDRTSRIEKFLTGNGQPGLITRVDRLEQSGKMLLKLGWFCLTTAIGGAAAYIFAMFKA